MYDAKQRASIYNAIIDVDVAAYMYIYHDMFLLS